MTSEVETATKTLNELQDARDECVARAAKLTSERSQIAYSAHAGRDKAAMERLRKINDATVLHNTELESLDAAIVEATKRLDIAHRAEALAADREKATQLRALAKHLVELAQNWDDCFVDFNGAAAE